MRIKLMITAQPSHNESCTCGKVNSQDNIKIVLWVNDDSIDAIGVNEQIKQRLGTQFVREHLITYSMHNLYFRQT